MSLAAGDMGTRISPADGSFCRAVVSGGQEGARIESKWWGEKICPVAAKDLADPHLNLVREYAAVASQLEGITMRSVFLFHIVAVACLMWVNLTACWKQVFWTGSRVVAGGSVLLLPR